MKWQARREGKEGERPSRYAIQSGPYIICQVWMFGKAGYCVYCGYEWLGFHDSAPAAKKAAADHKGAA